MCNNEFVTNLKVSWRDWETPPKILGVGLQAKIRNRVVPNSKQECWATFRYNEYEYCHLCLLIAYNTLLPCHLCSVKCIGVLANDELERICKVLVVIYLKGIFQHFYWNVWGKLQNSSVKRVGCRVKIWTQDLRLPIYDFWYRALSLQLTSCIHRVFISMQNTEIELAHLSVVNRTHNEEKPMEWLVALSRYRSESSYWDTKQNNSTCYSSRLQVIAPLLPHFEKTGYLIMNTSAKLIVNISLINESLHWYSPSKWN
jgi:hypothetical protein